MLNAEKIIDRTKEILGVVRQKEIAKHFNVTQKSVSEWRNGNTNIPYNRLIDLAAINNINLNWYFYGVGNKFLSNNQVANNNNNNNNNNNFYLVLDRPISEVEEENLRKIASYIDYSPPAYIEQVIAKLNNFKTDCLE